MRLVCVARHVFLAEHLCRVFGELGGQCEHAVGIAAAGQLASTFEPHLLIAEDSLLSPTVLDAWGAVEGLRDVPVLAVSLTHRAEESVSVELSGLAGVIFLPSLNRDEVLSLMEGARRPRGVVAPAEREASAFRSASVLR